MAIGLYPLSEIAEPVLDPGGSRGMSWHIDTGSEIPAETIGDTALTDDAMHPILPAGSIVAVDRSVNDPVGLAGPDRRGTSQQQSR